MAGTELLLNSSRRFQDGALNYCDGFEIFPNGGSISGAPTLRYSAGKCACNLPRGTSLAEGFQILPDGQSGTSKGFYTDLIVTEAVYALESFYEVPL